VLVTGLTLVFAGLIRQGIAGVPGLRAEAQQGVARGDASGSVREIPYQTRDGGVIFGNLYGEGPHAVLLGDGVIFDKESWDHLAARLAAEGHTALAIDFRGYGESKAGQSRGGLDEDIIGGVRYLREQGAARVSVIGASMGGGAVGDAVTPLASGDIDALILLAAVPTRSPERLQGRKLFIVSDGDASRSSVERQFQAAGEPKELTILPGSAHAQHIFPTARGEELTEIILTWIDAG
jgi:alpha-beta hydrolase superfamily lysophospholipase